MAFASVGETANYVGQDVEVNTDVVWPLVADLWQPDLANGVFTTEATVPFGVK